MGKIKNEINKNLLVCRKINEYQFKLMSLKNILSKDLVEHNLKDIPQTTKKNTVNEDLELYDEAQKRGSPSSIYEDKSFKFRASLEDKNPHIHIDNTQNIHTNYHTNV